MSPNKLRSILTALLFLGTASSASANVTLTGNLTADNYFFAFLSTSANARGTQIGSGTDWSTTYSLTSTVLNPGTTYYLNIEAINGDGGAWSAGGLIGSFSLTAGGLFGNGSQTVSTGGAGWTGGYNNSNNSAAAQTWVQPTGSVASEGLNGIGPWGTRTGISSSASWIWATDSQSSNGNAAPGNQCAGCTVDFQIAITTAAIPEPASMGLLMLGAVGVGAVRRRRRSAR
jgi:hypothetical protein